MRTPRFEVVALPGMPMVNAGDDLAGLLLAAVADNGYTLRDGDVVAVAQKIVSKVEGRLIPLADVTPSEEAIELAAKTDKDPRMVQLVLSESTEVVRHRPGVLIVRHNLGFVAANAGIDQSNIEHGAEGEENVLLLPLDPDASAAALRTELMKRAGCTVSVLITDSHNRPWRLGTVGTAIGSAGMTVLDDYRGGEDLYGRELKVTLINRADALAGAATLVMGETTEAIPAALIRGMAAEASSDTSAMINRPVAEDLFR